MKAQHKCNMNISGAVVMDCEYFPCLSWIDIFLNTEEIIIEQYEHFVKASYRNRAYIAGPNGVICLSIPLQKGRNQRTIMKDVKICNDEAWQKHHWKSLEACYRRSAYFEYYENTLYPFFEKKFTYLVDLNMSSLEAVLQCLKLRKRLTLSDRYGQHYKKDLRNEMIPGRRSENHGSFYTLNPFEEYIQPFSHRNGFEPNLSILDYLFCCGKMR